MSIAFLWQDMNKMWPLVVTLGGILFAGPAFATRPGQDAGHEAHAKGGPQRSGHPHEAGARSLRGLVDPLFGRYAHLSSDRVQLQMQLFQSKGNTRAHMLTDRAVLSLRASSADDQLIHLWGDENVYRVPGPERGIVVHFPQDNSFA